MICDPQIINQNIFEKKSELKLLFLRVFGFFFWLDELFCFCFFIQGGRVCSLLSIITINV